MRYAFLTTEFPTTLYGAGGLSTYTRRMARLLAEAGHEVEVFVLNSVRADTLRQEGYTVRHVCHLPGRFAVLGYKVIRNLGAPGAVAAWEIRTAARIIAAVLETRHAEAPFDVVQSPDHFGLGTEVARRPGRLHVVRCSAAMDLYMAADGRAEPAAAAQVAAERSAVAGADLAIAPSSLVAGHYTRVLGREVQVVRPPAFLEDSPGSRPLWLPPRYLVHFAGWLSSRKGTELISRALPEALRSAPDLVMLWFGRLPGGAAGAGLRVCPQNLMIADSLDKATLYRVVRDAAAVVLPSQVDNTPNTLIESLLLGAPIIVSQGASQDELISPGPGFATIPLGDASALAEALVSAWRGRIGVPPMPWLDTDIGAPCRPEAALMAHLSAVEKVRAAC